MEYKQHGKQLLDELRAIELEADEIALDNSFGEVMSYVFFIDYAHPQPNIPFMILFSLPLYRQSDTRYCCFADREQFATFCDVIRCYTHFGKGAELITSIASITPNARVEKIEKPIQNLLPFLSPTGTINISLYCYTFHGCVKRLLQKIRENDGIIKRIVSMKNSYQRLDITLPKFSLYHYMNDPAVYAIRQ